MEIDSKTLVMVGCVVFVLISGAFLSKFVQRASVLEQKHEPYEGHVVAAIISGAFTLYFAGHAGYAVNRFIMQML